MRKFRPSLLSGLLVAALVVALAIPAAADLVPRQLQVDAGVEVYINGNQLDPRDVISHAERRDALAVCGIQRAVQRAQQRGVPVCRRADLLKNASKAVQLASSPLIATLV